MITKDQIQDEAAGNSYAKGVQIYQRGMVKQFRVTESEDGEFDDIIALVQGSGRNQYNVAISISLYDDEIEYIDCECPAFTEYYGYCKHCVAVLLQYLDYCKKKLLDVNEKESHGGIFADSKYNIQKGITQKTTPAINRLLKQREKTRLIPLMERETSGKIKLEPIMYFQENSIYVTFKIGMGQMYVVKDVFELIRHIEEQDRYRYGKKLEFLHSMDAFDDSAKKQVEFLKRWTTEHEEEFRNYNYYNYYGYSHAAPKSKEMKLSAYEVEPYLELMRGHSFEAQVLGMLEKTWQISKDALKKNLRLEGDRDGLSLKLQQIPGYELDQGNLYLMDGYMYLEPFSKKEAVREFQKAMGEIPSREAFIEKEDIPAFCKELLSDLEEYYDCEIINFDKEEYGILTPDYKIYLDAPQTEMITVRPLAVYGEKEYSLYDMTDISLRNLEDEQLVRNLVREYGNAFDQETGSVTAVEDEEVIYELLVYGVPKMQQVAEVFVSDAIKRMEVRSVPKITVGVSIESGLMNLTLDSGDMSREELIEILSKYNRKKKFYRLKNGTFFNADQSGLEDVMELKQGLQLTDKEFKKQQIKVEKYRSLYVDEQLKESQAIASVRKKSFRELIRNMKTVEDNDFEIPESLESTLREYQKKGFLWLKTLKHNGFGGILADDMGLGKTLQVITFLLSEHEENREEDNGKENYCKEDNNRKDYSKEDSSKEKNSKETIKNEGKTIIITPASLVFNWYEEFQKFAPELPVHMAVGTASQRREIIEGLEDGDIVITSYDLLKRDIKLYETVTFSNEFIDEAQYIKNHNTQVAKAVKAVEASFKLALTGTPVENRLSELWSIFDYLMPGFLYGYKKFREELESPIVSNQDDIAAKRLRKMIHPFVLRRLKKEVLKDLPDKLEENVFAKMEKEQQKVYDAHVKRLKLLLDKQTDEEFKTSKIVVLSELTKLRQLCCDPSLILEGYKGGSAKKEMCITFIQNAVDNGHKILLFSQFTSMLDELSECFKEAGISYYMLTGQTSKEKRRQMVNAFNQDDTSVFCISLKAGGTGLNLTAADVVIHYDPWWNLAVQNQATDRAHRIGQEHVVNVYKLIVKGSIEENIVKMQEKKKELADQILGAEGMDAGSFTREELMEILR